MPRITGWLGYAGIAMTANYSIVRVGSHYVVRAEEKSVLTIASRRMATRLVAKASELLDSDSGSEQQMFPEAAASASIDRDRSEVS
jgi:hypothetical protein